jgi:hypothetical protein
MLEILNIRRRMRTYADVCGRMLTGRSEDDIMLEILNIRRRMRTYADVCGRMLTGRSEDDIMLEIIIFIGTCVSDDKCAPIFASSQLVQVRHTAAYVTYSSVSKRQHTSAYVSIHRQVCPHYRQLPLSTGTAV